jgi:hypothetical protein
MRTLTTQMHKVWISNPMPIEAQLNDQKPKKNSKSPSSRRKPANAKIWQESGKPSEKSKEKLKLNSKLTKLPLRQTPPETLSASSPLGRFYHVLLLSTTR